MDQALLRLRMTFSAGRLDLLMGDDRVEIAYTELGSLVGTTRSSFCTPASLIAAAHHIIRRYEPDEKPES